MAEVSDVYVSGQFCDLREEAAQTRSDIREAISSQGVSNVAQFQHVGEKACDAEKEAIKAQYEGKLQTLTSASQTDAGVSASTRYIHEKLDGFERNVDVRFADTALNTVRETGLIREQAAAGFAAVALAGAKDAATLAAQIAECCCEQKLAIAKLSADTDAGFCKVSEDGIRRELKAANDELAEARFDRIYDKIGSGNGKS